MAQLSRENETKLRAAIAEYELQAAEDLIVDLSMECAALFVTVPEDYAKAGTSRYGGVPDLPDASLWPRLGDEETNGKFYNFYMQINLADVPDFAGNVLPRTGMLYFFLAYHDMGKVVWADGEPSDFKRAEAKTPDELTGWDDGASNPYKLEIRAVVNPPAWYGGLYAKIEGALEEAGEEPTEGYGDFARDMVQGDDGQRFAGQLLGHAAYIGYDPDEGDDEPPTGTLLLMLDTNRQVDMMFGDAGYVQLFIERDALAKHDFSSIFSRVESS